MVIEIIGNNSDGKCLRNNVAAYDRQGRMLKESPGTKKHIRRIDMKVIECQ